MQLPTSFGAATYFLSATPPRMRNRTVTSQPPFVSVSVCKPSCVCVCVCVKMKKKIYLGALRPSDHNVALDG